MQQHQRKCLRCWASGLLTVWLCWSGIPAFAQNSNNNGQSQYDHGKGQNKDRRKAANDELAAEVAARIQADPQFKAYVDAVNAHKQAVDNWVKNNKGNGGNGKGGGK
jgi:hypothetical protein